MKYKYFKIAIPVLILASTVFSGCKKNFLDINDNPNNPTDKNITPELIFNQAANAVGARMASQNFRFVDNWMGYFSPPGDFAIQQDETSYNVDFSFFEGPWQGHYNILFDLHQAEIKARAKGDTVLAGASMVLAVKLWQELVDMFGDIPYSQAFQYQLTRTPAYDKAQDIYNDLQKKLDTAINFLQQTPRKNFPNYIGSIIRIGNEVLGTASNATPVPIKVGHWIKFANTLKLRLLIRQSQLPTLNPAPEIAKILANGGVLGAGESVASNPGYSNETGKQMPFYGNYAFTPTGADANTSTRANSYIVSRMTGDPRIKRFFTPVGTTVVGTVYGLASGNPAGAASSKVGPGTAGSATMDQWILPSFESMFLYAEAVARGWMPGNAQTAYEAAVTESFVWLGLTSGDAATYLAGAGSWSANAGATVASQTKFIAYQKYLALTTIDPLEAWSDLRRLNMLTNTSYISVNPSKISNVLPVRFLYPQSEYTTNSTNVNAEGTINMFTSKIFWQP
jgi:hypothetical protein